MTDIMNETLNDELLDRNCLYFRMFHEKEVINKERAVSPSIVIYSNGVFNDQEIVENFYTKISPVLSDYGHTESSFYDTIQQYLVTRGRADLIVKTEGLEYELEVYRYLTENILRTNICNNFLDLYKYGYCDTNVLTNDEKKALDELCSNIVSNIPNIQLRIVTTPRIENSISYYRFMRLCIEDRDQKEQKDTEQELLFLRGRPTITNKAFLKVYFQIVYALCVMQIYGIQHNDLHGDNIRVSYIQEGRNMKFVIGDENNRKVFGFFTRYFPIIFDWDFAYVRAIGKNPYLTYSCMRNNICNIIEPRRDLYFISTISRYFLPKNIKKYYDQEKYSIYYAQEQAFFDRKKYEEKNIPEIVNDPNAILIYESKHDPNRKEKVYERTNVPASENKYVVLSKNMKYVIVTIENSKVRFAFTNVKISRRDRDRIIALTDDNGKPVCEKYGDTYRCKKWDEISVYLQGMFPIGTKIKHIFLRMLPADSGRQSFVVFPYKNQMGRMVVIDRKLPKPLDLIFNDDFKIFDINPEEEKRHQDIDTNTLIVSDYVVNPLIAKHPSDKEYIESGDELEENEIKDSEFQPFVTQPVTQFEPAFTAPSMVPIQDSKSVSTGYEYKGYDPSDWETDEKAPAVDTSMYQTMFGTLNPNIFQSTQLQRILSDNARDNYQDEDENNDDDQE